MKRIFALCVVCLILFVSTAFSEPLISPDVLVYNLNQLDYCSAEYIEDSNQLIFIMQPDYDEIAWEYAQDYIKKSTMESFNNISTKVNSMLESCGIPGAISVCIFKTNDDAIIGLCVNGNVLTDYI